MAWCFVRGCHFPAKARPLTSRESQLERDTRIQHAKGRRIRRLCGWNVFQRSHFEGAPTAPSEWKTKQKEASNLWRSMSREEREPYEIHAQAEQAKIDALANKPLPSKQEVTGAAGAIDLSADDDDGAGVWRNAAKKISCRRLALNNDSFSSHPFWSLPTQFGDSELAALVDLFL